MWKNLIRIISIFILLIVSISIILNKYISKQKFIISNLFNFSSRDFYPCIAVIVEFRSTDGLISVVHNVNYHIPSTWPVQIFHGKENENFIKNSTLAPLIASGKIFLTIMKESASDRSQTDALLTNANFWKQVPGEKILLFQIDSIMCSHQGGKLFGHFGAFSAIPIHSQPFPSIPSHSQLGMAFSP